MSKSKYVNADLQGRTKAGTITDGVLSEFAQFQLLSEFSNFSLVSLISVVQLEILYCCLRGCSSTASYEKDCHNLPTRTPTSKAWSEEQSADPEKQQTSSYGCLNTILFLVGVTNQAVTV